MGGPHHDFSLGCLLWLYAWGAHYWDSFIKLAPPYFFLRGWFSLNTSPGGLMNSLWVFHLGGTIVCNLVCTPFEQAPMCFSSLIGPIAIIYLNGRYCDFIWFYHWVPTLLIRKIKYFWNLHGVTVQIIIASK